MSLTRVNLDPLYIYADPADGTGHLFVEQGPRFESHIRTELERLLPTANRFLDIGANVGFHTLTARCIRPDVPVVAFEAHQASADLLIRACVEQHQHGITLFTTVLNDHCGHVMIDRTHSNATAAPVGAWQPSSTIHYTACTTLNSYDLTGVDLVKMDVDGFEYRILRGASHLLAQRPTIIFEYHLGVVGRSGITGLTLLHLLQSHGYAFTTLTPERTSFGTDCGAVHAFTERCFEQATDILATPLP